MEIRKITSEDQARIPDEVRTALGLRAGDAPEWEVAEGAARVRKAAPIDWEFLKGVEANLAEEWLSPEDMKAWRDL